MITSLAIPFTETTGAHYYSLPLTIGRYVLDRGKDCSQWFEWGWSGAKKYGFLWIRRKYSSMRFSIIIKYEKAPKSIWKKIQEKIFNFSTVSLKCMQFAFKKSVLIHFKIMPLTSQRYICIRRNRVKKSVWFVQYVGKTEMPAVKSGFKMWFFLSRQDYMYGVSQKLRKWIERALIALLQWKLHAHLRDSTISFISD